MQNETHDGLKAVAEFINKNGLLMFIGFCGGTVDYLRELKSKRNMLKSFSFIAWAAKVFMAVFVAVNAGILCEYMGVEGDIVYVVVGGASLSSRSMLDCLQNFTIAFFKRRSVIQFFTKIFGIEKK